MNATTYDLRRPFAGRMLADPARRLLISHPARRVCRAVSAYRSHVAVRGCALLATDSRNLTLTCRLAYSNTVCSRGHASPTQYPLTDSNQCTRCLRGLPGNLSQILCSWYTISQLACATGGRMIAPYQPSASRDVPFRLYGSLRAVKVEFPCRPELPPLTVLAPPVGPASTASRWSNHRRKVSQT